MEGSLPLEVACSYLIHNGQDVVPGKGSLLGSLEVYDHHSMEVAVPIGFNVKNVLPKIVSLYLCKVCISVIILNSTLPHHEKRKPN